MPKDAFSGRLESRWDDARAAGMSEPELLLYRSNLLGGDKRITNYGGGNTSAKVTETDPLTREPVVVLWVKGSGGDVGSMKLDGFSTLYMSKLEALKSLYRGPDHEDEMVGYLPHATFRLNPRAASIDTPLHAYVPRKHVDHMHADAIIAIAASANSQELTRANLRRRHRLAALEAPRLRARPLAGEIRPREPGRPRRRPRKPRPLHLGRHRQGLLRDHARRHQPGHRLARPRNRRQARLRRPEARAARRPPSAAASPRR